jgi:hypothetical protein
MEHEVMWAPDGAPGLEHARVTWHTEGVSAEGVMIRRHADRTVRVRYAVRCDRQWRVREVRVAGVDPDEPDLRLHADGQGRWRDNDGHTLSSLDGCLDVDLWAVAFTNTLPIRRLELQPGASAEVAVAYIALPTLEVTRARQRYTCVERSPDRSLYRYEALPSGFTAEIMVDAQGLVVDYPRLGRRVWSS